MTRHSQCHGFDRTEAPALRPVKRHVGIAGLLHMQQVLVRQRFVDDRDPGVTGSKLDDGLHL